MQPEIIAYHHPATGTVTYLIIDPATFLCAIVDPVLDFDPETEAVDTGFVDKIIADIRARDLGPTWILETGLHTGHLSAAGHLKYETGASICIGARVVESLKRLAPLLAEDGVDLEGWDFDKLAKHGESLPMGGLKITALALESRLPGAVAYRVANAIFTGDVLLAPSEGSGRCDVPGADAGKTFDDARKILSLPPQTRILPGVCAALPCESTVAEEKASNIQLNDTVDRLNFIALRTTADAMLPESMVAGPALRIAVRAGRLPPDIGAGARFAPVDLTKL